MSSRLSKSLPFVAPQHSPPPTSSLELLLCRLTDHNAHAPGPTARQHAFQITVPLPPNVPIDALASAYERCALSRILRSALFRLGSHIPGRRGEVQPWPLPGLAANLRVGQPVGALSTVAAKDPVHKELLMTWVHPPSRASGSTWLKIAPAPAPAPTSPPPASSTNATTSAATVKDLAKHLIAHDRVHLQIGSTLDTAACPASALLTTVPSGVMDKAYGLYLRMVLLNASIQLWWDLRHVLRPNPVGAAKAVAERAGIHLPKPPALPGRGGGAGGPMVEDRSNVGPR